MKIPIIRKGEYDIWSMRMRQYICHTDHNLWDVIVNGDLEEEPAPTGETSAPPAPKTAKQLAAKRNQEREAIKSRFGGNEESKKIQKNVLKHQFKNFTTASNESLDKAYDRFQKLISQLEVHGAPISKEDINQKFLRSLPPSWNQIALIMRNKPDIDEIDIDDLYNNLRVYKDEMKRSSSSTSTSQNLAFPSSENTSSTNEVSNANGDFRIDEDDLEELDLRLQEAILTSKIECYNCHRKGHFARECRSGRNQRRRYYGDNDRSNAPTNESSSQALVAQDGLGGYDWSNDFEVEPINYALMAISSSSSSSSSDNKEESSKNLDELLNSQMSARDKTGLGYGTQLNEMSNNSETDSEISLSVFDVRSSDEESTPANDRFSKADGYHVVPPPITGNFLTPRADISFAGLDEYAIRKKIIESKTTELNADTSKSKTSETVGNTNEVNVEKPKSVNESVVSTPNINKDKVIIEDWNSDDENDVSEVSPIKTNETQTAKTKVDKIGQTSKKAGIRFKKIKACFVCKSIDHLIKDYDFYDKKSPEPKLKNVVNTSQRVVKLVWDNAKRVNHQKISNKLNYPQARRTFVPSEVLTRTGLVNPVRLNEKKVVQTINTARPVSTARSVSTARPFAPKTAQTSSAVRPIYPRMNNGNPEIFLQDHAVVDSGCSSHMTGNTAYLSDYEDYNGGFVAFGSDPKGDELKFNLFSVSQMCDKKNSVLFTDTECLILSPSFKLLDESQVVLRAPRKDDVYSLDLKNIIPFGDEMKRSSSSTSTSQNLAFLSSENTSSTNEVSTASGDFEVSTAGGISQVSSTPCAHDVCYNCHRKGHFAREYRSGRNQGKRSYGDNGRSNAPTNESSSQVLVAQDGLGGYDWSNDFEIEPVNYALMAISSSSSSSSSGHEELEKVVKERDELKLKIEKWEESSKNLDELLNSQMSARDKTGLGYGTQLNEMSNNSETNSEISLSVFDVRSSDEESTPANDRDKVIIEDWNSDDEDDVSEVQTVSPVKTNETQTSQEPKMKTVVNTGLRVDKPVWDNTKRGNPEILLQDHAVVDSGCSSHMTGNKAYLSDYEDYNGGFVAFGLSNVFNCIKARHHVCCLDSPFELETYSDSDNGGASLDRKSILGGCQFIGRRLISWQCKKQTIVANSTTEAEYVAAANCCGQVLWIQNQMMDYGFNFMNTKIHIDNESTISVIKNPVAHSRTKHIEIRFHFIRDCYKKRLIEVIKIHTDHNVADLI
ncbi:ribonuclease H-like domain-containing protein [Tanacetum coccineum]